MKRSLETRARISVAKRSKKQSPETIAKRVAKTRGRKQSFEEIEKRAAKLRGRKQRNRIDWSARIAALGDLSDGRAGRKIGIRKFTRQESKMRSRTRRYLNQISSATHL